MIRRNLRLPIGGKGIWTGSLLQVKVKVTSCLILQLTAEVLCSVGTDLRRAVVGCAFDVAMLPLCKCCQFSVSISNEGCSVMDLEDRIVCFAARCVKVCSVLPVKTIAHWQH